MAQKCRRAESNSRAAKARARAGSGNREGQIARNALGRDRRIRTRLVPRSRLGNQEAAGQAAMPRPSLPISSHSKYPAVLTNTRNYQRDILNEKIWEAMAAA